VGQGRWEEVDIVVKGGDYGWSYREGFHPFTGGPGGSKLPAKFEPLDPIFEYPRNVGISITGGVVYRGTDLADLKENYIFADFGTGSVIALHEKAGKWEPQMLAKESGIAGIGTNPRNGDVLFTNLNGTIKKLKVQ
jgi:quinoprotein glucose dehydrogenase